jgi:hypothetical protein
MSDGCFNDVDIELSLYEHGGRWTGQYILTKRFGSGILNEVSSLSKQGDSRDEARQIGLCEARRSVDRFVAAAPALLKKVAEA